MRAYNQPNAHRIEGDTAIIILTDRQGNRTGEAVIDVADLDKALAAGRWHKQTVYPTGRNPISYAGCYVRKTSPHYTHRDQRLYLHRIVMDATTEQKVDHEDGDGLNCRKSNLRVASSRENAVNSYLHRKIRKLEEALAARG